MVAELKELKTGCSLAESLKECGGSKRDVLAMMMVAAAAATTMNIKLSALLDYVL
jgi:hypothetical protein